MANQGPGEQGASSDAAAVDDVGGDRAGGEADERTRLMARCRDLEEMLRAILDNLPIVAWRVDQEGTILFHDGRGMEGAESPPGEFVGKNAFDLYPDEISAPVRQALGGKLVHAQVEAHGVCWENWEIPVRNAQGDVTSVIGLSLDTTEARRVERELRDQLDVVSRQRQVIQDLSTPILQIWDGVLALPMIGVIDSMRTAEVMDSLLAAVVRDRARFALLDLTGVEAVDTKTASYLIDLVRAIRLLGAEGVITGIRPSVAQTIVLLGVELNEITTLGNLRAGLRHCIVQMRRQELEAGKPHTKGSEKASGSS
ncbi:STAS domain-containing protein [Chondromyces crocatus]|uniref:Anti-anti sigma factor protein n=1 Tax=Chondromyces crocatus TaxID=52 RepID=A0A0K1E673_CHOCO|nr:STAS domain-containing protein [Chondromyces crocatus]AKT36354.1 anti-anti sigma factor protein [Chondromyces crocatus]